MSTNGERVSVLLTVSDETRNQKFYVRGYTSFFPEHKHVDGRGRQSIHSVLQNCVLHEGESRKTYLIR